MPNPNAEFKEPKPSDTNVHQYITPNPLGNKRPWDEFFDMKYI